MENPSFFASTAYWSRRSAVYGERNSWQWHAVTSYFERISVSGRKGMCCASQPLAVAAGNKILAQVCAAFQSDFQNSSSNFKNRVGQQLMLP